MYGICTARWDNVLSQVEAPIEDYFEAWRRAGEWRVRRPSAVFVVVDFESPPEDPVQTISQVGARSLAPPMSSGKAGQRS